MLLPWRHLYTTAYISHVQYIQIILAGGLGVIEPVDESVSRVFIGKVLTKLAKNDPKVPVCIANDSAEKQNSCGGKWKNVRRYNVVWKEMSFVEQYRKYCTCVTSSKAGLAKYFIKASHAITNKQATVLLRDAKARRTLVHLSHAIVILKHGIEFET